MTNAATPAPHTPVIYVKGGGSASFSAECQALLIRAGLDPDKFGSYTQVRKQVMEAGIKVDAKKRNDAAGIATPADKEPTAEDRALADSKAAHLIQSAAHRQDGGRRTVKENPNDPLTKTKVIHDPCTNVVPGYVDGEAPAVAIPGNLEAKMGEEERQQSLAQQKKNADANAAKPNSVPPDQYPADQRHKDDAARAEKIVREMEAAKTGSSKPTAPGAGVAGAGTAASSPVTGGAVSGTAPAKPSGPPLSPSELDSAAQCVKNWLSLKEQEMKTDGVDAEIDRLEKMAADKPAVAEVGAKRAATEAAREPITKAEKELSDAKEAARKAREEEKVVKALAKEAKSPADLGGLSPSQAVKDRQAAEDRVAAAEKALGQPATDKTPATGVHATQEAAIKKADDELQAAEYKHGPADLAQKHADCLKEQKPFIVTQPGEFDPGRTP
jgi:hypothetical protein